MKKCKECGREEWGFLSALNEDGYCPRCAIVHNEEKIKKLKQQIDYALEVMGQIAMYSDNKVDALQCANAIITIKDWGENDRR